MTLGIFGQQATVPTGFENGLGFQNYLLDGTQSGTAGLPNQSPWMMDWGQLGIGGKLGVVSQGLGAFSNLANIYAGFKAMKLQRDQFNFAKEAWQKNYNNQVKDYENTLKDRWTARAAGYIAGGGDPNNLTSMGSWVAQRGLTGEAPGYQAASPQGFYANQSQQEKTPIQRAAGGGNG